MFLILEPIQIKSIIILRQMQLESILEKYHTPPPNYSLSEHVINGFSGCPSIAQIASYLVISLSIAVYFSCIVSIHFNVVLLILYVILGVILVVTSLLATVCDPTDRVVYYYKWSRHDKKIIFAPDYSKVLFCQFCDSYCLSTSKHCRSCNRCVNNFDHHCMWFNNCVGESNYKYFLASIISSFAYLIVIIIHVAISSAYVDYGSMTELTKIILSWVTGSLLGIFAFLLFNLILLHLYLLASNQTTFMFLQRKKKEEEKQKQQRQKLNISKASIIPIKIRHQIQQQEIVSKQNIVIIGKESQQMSSITHPGRKVSNQFFSQITEMRKDVKEQKSQEEQWESNKSINKKSIPSSSSQFGNNDATLIRESSNQFQLNSENGQAKLPSFLSKNRSLRLLLSSSQIETPSKRRLQTIH